MRPLGRSRAPFRAARHAGGAWGAAFAACAASSPAPAWGAPREHAVVRLSYQRGPGAEACPDEAAVREAVLARLGYDPFDDTAPRRLRASVGRSGHRDGPLVARIELRDAAGALQGERDLRGAGSDCTELATAMAIAISLGIDPLSAAEPHASPTPVTPTIPVTRITVTEEPTVRHEEASGVRVAPTPPPEPRRAPPDAPAGPPLHARFAVGGVVSWGISPAVPAVGGTVDAGIRRGAWSLDVEGAGDWAATATDGASGVKSSLVLASLAPCVHVWIGVGCALGGMGSLYATGVVRAPESAHALFADAGVRLGVEVPFARRFFARAHADGLATLTHVTYHLDGQTAWSTPPLSLSLGLAAGFER